jgi:hypothetical protein
LLIREGNDALTDVPPPDVSQQLQSVTSEFVVSDYMAPADYRVTTVFHGGAADDMRGFLAGSSLKELGDQYLNYNARFYAAITNPSPLRVTDDRERNRLTVVEEYEVGELWEIDESTGQWEASF